MLSAQRIKNIAFELGFSLCGIASYRVMSEHEKYLAHWLENSSNGALSYMNRYEDIRLDPALLLCGTASVVVCAVNYKTSDRLFQNLSNDNKIASYALAQDYHITIKSMLNQLSEALKGEYEGLSLRPCVDSAPILEKAWAVEAGLGVVGRNSLLLTREFGSTVLLGELLLDARVDVYDSPLDWDACEGCTKCLDACPSGALKGNKTLDARECISALTTHHKAEIDTPERLHGWLYGCEHCQIVCPWNKLSPETHDLRFKPVVSEQNSAKEFWVNASKSDFKLKYSKTPIFRTKFEVLRQRMGLNQN